MIPMRHRRALPATAGSVVYVDRSGIALFAPHHKSLRRMVMYLQHLICSCQGSSARPGFSSNGDDAFHHPCVVAIQLRIYFPQERHLFLGE